MFIQLEKLINSEMLAIKDRVPPLVKTYKIPIKEKYSAAASAISFPKRERE